MREHGEGSRVVRFEPFALVPAVCDGERKRGDGARCSSRSRLFFSSLVIGFAGGHGWIADASFSLLAQSSKAQQSRRGVEGSNTGSLSSAQFYRSGILIRRSQ